MTIGACRCGRHWTGLHESHCVRCHEHFSTVANFDHHQRLVSGAVVCLSPVRVGLVAHTGPHGITWRASSAGRPRWGSPK